MSAGADAGSTGARDAAVRGLAGDDGILIGLAIDHRDNFRAVLARAERHDVDVPARKTAIVRALAPGASAIMLDHELGMPAITSGAVPDGVALIMPLEAQGYEQLGDDRTTDLMTDFTAADAAGLGASACKLLLPYRSDRPAAAAHQRAIAASAIDACHGVGLPLILEPTVYQLEAEPEGAYEARYEELVIRATAETATLEPDVLKLPYPSRRDPADDGAAASLSCRRLAAAADGIPWVLLGAGVAADVFERQLATAGSAGAAGFLAGRSIWSDAAVADDGDLGARLDEANRRLERFAALSRETAAPLRPRST